MGARVRVYVSVNRLFVCSLSYMWIAQSDTFGPFYFIPLDRLLSNLLVGHFFIQDCPLYPFGLSSVDLTQKSCRSFHSKLRFCKSIKANCKLITANCKPITVNCKMITAKIISVCCEMIVNQFSGLFSYKLYPVTLSTEL